MDNQRIGGFVKHIRRKNKMSQAELAQKSGTSPATVSRVEAGKTTVSLEGFVRILKACGMDARFCRASQGELVNLVIGKEK